eukprot:TRINITY_DN2496_c0_g1_i4.p2 TRINITY_DN2496_c0_g1~~TRINITY_DN2496_c0_g1_i4.p2  ORF type:complete len:367 (+),score=92.62 TRINITY_DN2496_c0_g1_i4:71-1171(+)
MEENSDGVEGLSMVSSLCFTVMGSLLKRSTQDERRLPNIQGTEEPEQGKLVPVCTSPEVQTGLKDRMLLQNCHPSQGKLHEKGSNLESSSVRVSRLSGSEKTTSNSGLSVLLIAPLLAFAATQNNQSLLLEENKKDKLPFVGMNEKDQNDPENQMMSIQNEVQDTSKKLELMLDSWILSQFQENLDDKPPFRGMKEQVDPEKQSVSIHHEVLDTSMKFSLGSKEELMLDRLLSSREEDVAAGLITWIDHSGDKEESTSNLHSFVQSADDDWHVSFPEVDQFERVMYTSLKLLRKDYAIALTDATQYILMTSGREDFLKNEDFQWNAAQGRFTEETATPRKKDDRKEKYEKENRFLDLDNKKVDILL